MGLSLTHITMAEFLRGLCHDCKLYRRFKSVFPLATPGALSHRVSKVKLVYIRPGLLRFRRCLRSRLGAASWGSEPSLPLSTACSRPDRVAARAPGSRWLAPTTGEAPALVCGWSRRRRRRGQAAARDPISCSTPLAWNARPVTQMRCSITASLRGPRRCAPFSCRSEGSAPRPTP